MVDVIRNTQTAQPVSNISVLYVIRRDAPTRFPLGSPEELRTLTTSDVEARPGSSTPGCSGYRGHRTQLATDRPFHVHMLELYIDDLSEE